MKLREIFERTLEERVSEIAKSIEGWSEKRLRAVLLFVGGEQFNGRKGWDYSKVSNDDLELSINEYDTYTDDKGKYIGKFKDNDEDTNTKESVNEVFEDSNGNNLEASIDTNNSEAFNESAVTTEQVVDTDNEEDSDNEDENINRKVIVTTSKRGRKKGSASTSSSKAEIEALINNIVDENSTRAYIGVYFDNDIAKFLKGVKHGNRSELINKIIRQYLVENGIKL